jgi:CelD/BcsL family acetyltransferase involved in cellulose biosynthesis
VQNLAAQSAGTLPPPLARDILSEPRIELLTADADFARLAPEWNMLHDQAAAASIFTSWIWQYQWWQVYGRGQRLRILVAREGGRTLGILPLYLDSSSKALGLRVRLLRFVGTGADTHPDDLGPILAAGAEEHAALLLARAALKVRGADLLLATDIDPRSVFGRALEKASAEAHRGCFSGRSERIAYTALPPAWDAFLQSLNSDRRSRMRSARRKTEAHKARFFLWQGAGTIGEALDKLADLHRRRWAGSGGSESFVTPEYLDFHRRIMQAAYPRGWLRLYCLELDGQVAAITYCYRFRNRVYLMQAGFDPALSKLNPGKVLLGHALEHAIAEGNEAFDFLRGEHRYKDELATGHRDTQCVRVFHLTPGALAYRLRRIWLPLLKARLLGRPAPKLLP